jgi:large subunit ribosomal protein L30
MYAVIRIRGTVSVAPNVKKTLEMLNLRRANNLSIWQDSEQIRLMFKEAENMLTYGKINDAVLAKLLEKRGEALEGKLDVKKALSELKSGKTANQAGVFNCFRMSPPKGGFERKGIKKSFNMGGAFGNRNEKINDLIEKMM